jgi:hypothetical protein
MIYLSTDMFLENPFKKLPLVLHNQEVAFYFANEIKHLKSIENDFLDFSSKN